ncbi:unnamed protein product [Timema podura]|uniref:Uncharacterized protein n=1 Tax=Timema podura TaxID=61482 RepID=A0ABN7PD37_TIMPD|nr:unnamed protein product [Timema podura]
MSRTIDLRFWRLPDCPETGLPWSTLPTLSLKGCLYYCVPTLSRATTHSVHTMPSPGKRTTGSPSTG